MHRWGEELNALLIIFIAIRTLVLHATKYLFDPGFFRSQCPDDSFVLVIAFGLTLISGSSFLSQ